MPMFLVERSFADELELSDDDLSNIREVSDMAGARWVASFLSADKRKTYCLYEAPNAEAIRSAAHRLNLPADVVVEVEEMRPEMFL